MVFLKNVMLIFLQDTRHIGELFNRSKGACSTFFGASIISLFISSLIFQVVYCTLKDRIEPPTPRWMRMYAWNIALWLYTLSACIVFASVYCVGLGIAVWIA